MPAKPTIHDWRYTEYLGRFAIEGVVDGRRVVREACWTSGGYVGTDFCDPAQKHVLRLGYAASDAPAYLSHPHFRQQRAA